MSHDGLIERNTFDRTSAQAVLFTSNDAGFRDSDGFVARRVTVRHNTFHECYTQRPDFGEIARHRKYLLGEIDEEEFLGADLSAQHVLNAHFTMGMKCLWSGDRKGAFSHFRIVSEPMTLGMPHAHWARALLERLEKDQEQPPKN